MAFDASAALQELYILVSHIEDLQECKLGVPKAVTKKVSAYVTLGGQAGRKQNMGGGPTPMRELRLYIGLVYRVQDDEGDAEMLLAEIVDRLVAAVDANQTLNGTCVNARLDLTLGDAPQYALWLGQEFRQYPVVVSVTQYQ